MTKQIGKYSHGKRELHQGTHRFEHWYVDNQVYFITARCSDRYPAFRTARACEIFWDRFDHWTRECQFTPWVTSLVVNHYHVLGYCRVGQRVGKMIQRIHGSTAKLVNDLLPERRAGFWSDPGHQDYFDGCIRDELQCRRAYRYILTQSRRHRLCDHWRDYPHTHVTVDLERGIRRALELNAFLEDVPYQRYRRKQ